MGFFGYAWRYLGPYFLLAALATLLFGLGGLVNLMIPGEGYTAGMQMLFIALGPILALVISYRIALRAQSFKTIASNFYITQVLVSGIVFGGIIVGLGGASQAMVEKSLTRDQFQVQSMYSIMSTLFYFHVFIVPWTIFATKRFIKKEKNF